MLHNGSPSVRSIMSSIHRGHNWKSLFSIRQRTATITATTIIFERLRFHCNGFPLWCNDLILFCCTMVSSMATGQSRVPNKLCSFFTIFEPPGFFWYEKSNQLIVHCTTSWLDTSERKHTTKPESIACIKGINWMKMSDMKLQDMKNIIWLHYSSLQCTIVA